MVGTVSAIFLKRKKGHVYVISYGIGVDSTALIVLALEGRIPVDYIVAADPGNEMPESYAYLEYVKPLLEKAGIPIVVVHPKDGRSLGQRCVDRGVIPDTHHRWCTRDTKIRPIHRFYRSLGKVRIVQYLGFDKGEARRIKRAAKRKSIDNLKITNCYPLYDFGLDRDACVSMIVQAMMKVPIKSSCTFCPYKSTGQWVYLYRNHRRDFYYAMRMEEANKYFPRQTLFRIPLRLLELMIQNRLPLPKSKYNDRCGSL